MIDMISYFFSHGWEPIHSIYALKRFLSVAMCHLIMICSNNIADHRFGDYETRTESSALRYTIRIFRCRLIPVRSLWPL